jgi:hypothetical protein
MEIKTSSKSEKPNPCQPSPESLSWQPSDSQDKRYYDRSDDMVARVRRAKEMAQGEMESFGDVSEYDITILQGQRKEDEPEPEAGPEAESRS